MRSVCAGIALALVSVTMSHAWGNGGTSKSLDKPVFGAHDYIAFKAYELAGKPAFIKNNLNAYFIGTEAPDLGTKPGDAEGGYNDTSPCHCILFDSAGQISKDFLEVRTQQEFDKAQVALTKGNKALAAFYVGALAHYLGDLSQFCHIMGKQSHFGKEDKAVHSKYETAINNTVDFHTRTSSFLDGFITPVPVSGTTAGAIAVSVARFTDEGTSGKNPRDMHTRYRALIKQKKSADPTEWDDEFGNATGRNVNLSVNGIAKVIGLLK